MSVKKAIGFMLLAGLMIAGTLFIALPSGLKPEVAARQSALGALAPIPVDRVDNVDILPTSIEPVIVNLDEIPSGVGDGRSQYELWASGQIDLESDGLRSEAELEARRRASAALEPNQSIQVGSSSFGESPSALIAWFASLDINSCCGGGANVPPDPELAVGLDHVIAVVNVAFEIYDKTGAVYIPVTTFSSFFGVNPNCTAGFGAFDPNILYDEKEDRFMMGVDGGGSFYCAAVSDDGDPAGTWFVYAFPTVTGSEFYDYPHAGVGDEAIFVGSNIFDPFFVEGRVHALDKLAMYAGAAAAFNSWSLGINEDTPQPLNLHGFGDGTWPVGSEHFFLTETGFNGCDHTVFSWDDPFGADIRSTVGMVDLCAATGVPGGFPVNVTQNGGGGLITANDFRPLDFEYRNGYGWTTMTIACNPGGGPVNCVRWAQIELATAAIGPQGAGVWASSGLHRWFPDLAVNSCEDMLVGYSISGPPIYPSVVANGRLSTTAPGNLSPRDYRIKGGEITYTAFDPAPRRWGDYTGMTIDPNGTTFWYLGEYSKITGNPNGRWGTWIVGVEIPGCTTP